jgi:ATP-dependent helicase HrpA
VVSAAHFDRWWRDERRSRPDLLTYTYDVLVRDDATDALDQRSSPSAWRQGELVLPLSYRFEPGAPSDGVTAHVPVRALGQLRGSEFLWLVPSLREELVTALLRSLPKELRRPLVPIPETAKQVLGRLEPRRAPLLDALAAELQRSRGVVVPPEAWDLSRLPEHLRIHFRVEGDDGKLLAEGDDLAILRAELGPRLRDELTRAAAPLERSGPDVVGRDRHAAADDRAAGHRAGRPRVPVARRRGRDRRREGLRHPGRPGGGDARRDAPPARAHDPLAAEVGDQAAAAGGADGARRRAARQRRRGARRRPPRPRSTCSSTRPAGPPWDEAGFAALRDHVAGRLAERTLKVAQQAASICDTEREVLRWLEERTAPAFADSARDVEAQLRRLLPPGFIQATGVRRLPDLERYLRAAARAWSACPTRSPSTATACAPSTSSRSCTRARPRRRRSPAARCPSRSPRRGGCSRSCASASSRRASGVRGQVSAKRIRKLLDSA